MNQDDIFHSKSELTYYAGQQVHKYYISHFTGLVIQPLTHIYIARLHTLYVMRGGGGGGGTSSDDQYAFLQTWHTSVPELSRWNMYISCEVVVCNT